MILKVIEWFEKRNRVSWVISFFIASVIFYVSSLSFNNISYSGLGLKAIIFHLGIFFIFSFFLFISIVKGKRREFLYVPIVISFVYGALDEFHQIFTPGRSSSIGDILLDWIGTFFSFLVYSITLQYRRIKKKNS